MLTYAIGLAERRKQGRQPCLGLRPWAGLADRADRIHFQELGLASLAGLARSRSNELGCSDSDAQEQCLQEVGDASKSIDDLNDARISGRK